MNETKCPQCGIRHAELPVDCEALSTLEVTMKAAGRAECEETHFKPDWQIGAQTLHEAATEASKTVERLLATLRMVAALNIIRDDTTIYNEVMRAIDSVEIPPEPAAGTYTMWACQNCICTFPEPVNMIDHLQCPDCHSADIFAYHATGCEDPAEEAKTGLHCETCGIKLDHLKCPDCSSVDIWPYKEQREDSDDEPESKFPVFRYEFNGSGQHRIVTTTAAGQEVVGEWQAYHNPTWLYIGRDQYVSFTAYFDGEVPAERVFKLVPQQTENPKEVLGYELYT